MSSDNLPILADGTAIAGYDIQSVLGEGAMGVVYLAKQRALERVVALKVLKPSLAQNEAFVRRFFNEARAAASLSHKSIVQAYDAGVDDQGIHYFVMEYVEGETLRDHLDRDGALEWKTVLDIGYALADALNAGWERQKLIHGDIKPENLMVTMDGELKLADFGLAKIARQDHISEGLMLTPLYAAPEIIRGEGSMDCRSDIYSFGATLYHLMIGYPPFPGTDPQTVMRRHLDEQVPSLHKRNPQIPENVSAFICGMMLAKDPNQRPADWATVRKELDALRTGQAEKGKKPAAAGCHLPPPRAAVHRTVSGHGPAKSAPGKKGKRKAYLAYIRHAPREKTDVDSWLFKAVAVIVILFILLIIVIAATR